MPRYNPLLLLGELITAGLPVDGCSSMGRVDWTAGPTPEEEQRAAEILAAHNPEPEWLKREEAYTRAGITHEAMVNALWQKIMEGDEKAALAIQAQREQVKSDIPPE